MKEKVKCEECGAMVRTLSQHIRIVHKQKGKYPCTSCDYKANTVTSLNAHKKRMHQDSKLQCDLCPFITKDLKRLEEHKNNIHLIHHLETTDGRNSGSEYFEAEGSKHIYGEKL